MPFFKRIGKLFSRKKREPEAEMPREVREQVEKLKHPESSERNKAVWALGDLGHASAIPHLVSMFQDPEQLVRWNAAKSLGRMKHESAVPALAKALKDENAEVRGRAAEALGKIGHESAVPILVKRLRNPDIVTRWSAADALGMIGHASAAPSLLKALQDPSPAVRHKAAEALAPIGRKLQGKNVKSKELKAFQLIGEHLNAREAPATVRKAYEAALEGKITRKNARLYVKQLRALEGKVK